MARARNIKPGLLKNEILGVADPLYTLLFEGLWLLADREGRLEDRPLRIKAEVFPYRDGLDMTAMLGWLESNGFIRRYQCVGLALIQILNFAKHQNPHKNEPESIYPAPEEIGTASEKIGTTRADSGFRIPDSGLSKPAPGAPTPPPLEQSKRRKPVATAMPDNFAISPRVREWSEKHGYQRLDEHLEAFRRKATAKGYTYSSWDDAFMEAIREDWAKLRDGKSRVAPPPEPRTRAGPDPELERLKAHKGAPIPANIREQLKALAGNGVKA